MAVSHDEHSIEHTLDVLSKPQPQETVESIEVALKRHWHALLEPGCDRDTARQFATTFHRIGFLRKYKSYGVKLSSPFGYSIFTLHDGRGFSVQVHQVAKVEAFHVFACHDTSYAILSSEADWHATRAEFLSEWHAGVLDDGPVGFRPHPGDVMVIDDLGVVHAVIGCVLEEYATTSNDAVLRLHDQNVGDEVRLPEAHADLAEILRPVSLAPRCRVTHERAGWQRVRLAEAGAVTTIVEMPDRGLRGFHLTLEPGHSHTLEAEPDSVITLVGLEGASNVTVAGIELALAPGDSVPIAPGFAAAVTAMTGACRIAVSIVREDLAFADLRTT